MLKKFFDAFKAKADLANIEVFAVVNPDGTAVGSGVGANRELVVNTFLATAGGTGYSSGDTITATRVLDVSGNSPAQVGATAWYNETTGASISAPSAANLEIAGQPGLTDAQLRAASVAVSGAAAVGSAPTNPPLSVSGVDGGGLKRHILTDTGGVVQVGGVDYATGSDGVRVPVSSLSQTLGYTNGALTSISVSYLGNTYIQTLTYTSGVLTGISNWVKQ